MAIVVNSLIHCTKHDTNCLAQITSKPFRALPKLRVTENISKPCLIEIERSMRGDQEGFQFMQLFLVMQSGLRKGFDGADLKPSMKSIIVHFLFYTKK